MLATKLVRIIYASERMINNKIVMPWNMENMTISISAIYDKAVGDSLIYITFQRMECMSHRPELTFQRLELRFQPLEKYTYRREAIPCLYEN